MQRPVLGIWERDLERELLRKGVGAVRAGASRCTGCGRTPLPGEYVDVLARGRIVCALCRPAQVEEPLRTERVLPGERGQSVRLRARAA